MPMGVSPRAVLSGFPDLVTLIPLRFKTPGPEGTADGLDICPDSSVARRSGAGSQETLCVKSPQILLAPVPELTAQALGLWSVLLLERRKKTEMPVSFTKKGRQTKQVRQTQHLVILTRSEDGQNFQVRPES